MEKEKKIVLKLYRPISEKKQTEKPCLKCGKPMIFVKIKEEAILFCPDPKCFTVACEWY